MAKHPAFSFKFPNKGEKKEPIKKPWAGRFKQPLAKAAELFSSSIHYDVRLFKQDIVQNIAYAKALLRAKVLTTAECQKIIKALEAILREFSAGKIKLDHSLEDVHMNIEAILTARVGDVGKKLHSGRSRNDQVVTDLRMYLKYEVTEIVMLIRQLQSVLLDLSEEHIKVIVPGYTHLQRAQPVLLSHHLLAYFEMLERDKTRFLQAQEAIDVLPLGSAALAGTSFEIGRDLLAKELGFAKISANSMDAVADRDFAIEFVSACSILMMHLSRFSEEIMIWSTWEFDYIELSDQYATGSSIMPQKKNPDMAELVRGKTGRVYGHLMALLTIMKGLPLTYNRDLQEDKEQVFGAIDTVKPCLNIFAEMLKTTKFHAEKMMQAAKKGYLTATDLAYYLVRRNVPFREAHQIVGEIVAYCEESNMEIEYLSLQQLKQFSPDFGYDVTRILSAQNSVTTKDLPGGTAPNRVKEAIKRARKHLLHDKA